MFSINLGGLTQRRAPATSDPIQAARQASHPSGKRMSEQAPCLHALLHSMRMIYATIYVPGYLNCFFNIVVLVEEALRPRNARLLASGLQFVPLAGRGDPVGRARTRPLIVHGEH